MIPIEPPRSRGALVRFTRTHSAPQAGRLNENRDSLRVEAVHRFVAFLPLVAVALWLAGAAAADPPRDEETQAPEKRLFTGKVVLLTDALTRRKIKFSPEELKGQVVLETPGGRLIPILPDWRGRAFYQDERLRNRSVELVGTRQPGLPYLQVSLVYTFNEQGERQYTDYWCDVCSIPIHEIKPCECCQGPVRLRFQTQDLPDYLKIKILSTPKK